MPNDNPACADCKAKKKRCIHRNQPVTIAEAEVIPASMSPPSDPAVPTPAPSPAPAAPAAPGAATRGRRKATEIAETKPKEASPAPADSSDELSSVLSEAEQKPVKKSTRRSCRAKPAKSQNGIPDFPADSLQAASTMSVHRVWARELETNLEELQRNMQTFDEAHRATMASAQNIQRTVEGWIQTWSATSR
ncbi:hypothetical protein N7447_010901 [Penicillium robsamsonii]|uniref:uncharacterized protein n=1 Tax=Penicillium robsamsonii TaxID=1792511 RepID=UPI0025483F59|nr:uncharacterized protein N7447_010901 [Penicillium robsamsonii]KAJ5807445.1 hypothetical protein N7447_010901 [Penicillium robsamsonii]